MPRSFRYSRPKTAPPQTLCEYLSQKFPYFTSEEWTKQVQDGYLAINQQVIQDPCRVLEQQDVILYSPPPAREPDVDVENIERLYEDDDVLVCCKNGNLPVTEGGRYCVNTLTSFLNKPHTKSSVPVKRMRSEAAEPLSHPHCSYFPVHRLDKETSGVLVFGKTAAATRQLSAAFELQSSSITTEVENHVGAASSGTQAVKMSPATFEALRTRHKTIGKCYATVLAGAAPVGAVYVVVTRVGAVAHDPAWRLREGHQKLSKLKMLCYAASESELPSSSPAALPTLDSEFVRSDPLGRVAASRITILDSNAALQVSVARVDILTGRTHQIRLHCAHSGYPIVGDKLYTTLTPGAFGGCYPVTDDVYLERVRSHTPRRDPLAPLFSARRHLLHATRLSLPHPTQPDNSMNYFADPTRWLLLDVESEDPAALATLKCMLQRAASHFTLLAPLASFQGSKVRAGTLTHNRTAASASSLMQRCLLFILVFIFFEPYPPLTAACSTDFKLYCCFTVRGKLISNNKTSSIVRKSERGTIREPPKRNYYSAPKKKKMKLYGATDFEGRKVNLEFTFSGRAAPSVYELYYKATTAFNNFFAYHGSPYTFHIRCGAVYDTDSRQWKTLHCSTTLTPESQVYFFQVDIPESMGPIDAPASSYPYLDGFRQQPPHRQPGVTRASAQPVEAQKVSAAGPPPPEAKDHSDSTSRSEGDDNNGLEGEGQVDWHTWDLPNESRSSSPGTRPPQRPSPSTLAVDEVARRSSSAIAFEHLGPNRRESVLRDEREKFERRMSLPIDDFRRTLRAESDSMRRSLSQHTSMAVVFFVISFSLHEAFLNASVYTFIFYSSADAGCCVSRCVRFFFRTDSLLNCILNCLGILSSGYCVGQDLSRVQWAYTARFVRDTRISIWFLLSPPPSINSVAAPPLIDEFKGTIDIAFTCMLCQSDIGKRFELARLHFLSEHGISAAAAESTNDSKREWLCPVCGKSAGIDCAALELHVAAVHHQRWNRHTVPGLCDFYTAQGGAASSSEDSEDERDPICEGDENASDREGEWDEMPAIQCLYCGYCGVDCLEHMILSHRFDLKATTSSREDVCDEYDLIRLVNDVRRSVALHRCPYFPARPSGEDAGQGESSGPACDFHAVEGEGDAAAATELEAHLRANPTHRVPQRISAGDAALLPALHGDALLSHLMTAGEGFLPQEEADPDYPVAPTLLQLAERRQRMRGNTKKKDE
eukprot:gene5945-4254_t